MTFKRTTPDMLDNLFVEEAEGETCPDCYSDNTVIKVLTRSGFAKMKCNDCEHTWTSEDSYTYG